MVDNRPDGINCEPLQLYSTLYLYLSRYSLILANLLRLDPRQLQHYLTSPSCPAYPAYPTYPNLSSPTTTTCHSTHLTASQRTTYCHRLSPPPRHSSISSIGSDTYGATESQSAVEPTNQPPPTWDIPFFYPRNRPAESLLSTPPTAEQIALVFSGITGLDWIGSDCIEAGTGKRLGE